ncbi:MAG: 5-(carboxyamino)imidazole ribonucleotide synthase [Pseudomonadales bacterium]|nr:5-(carboxyamino)imidazole ribonucleotide synthase [Pseudomonadales bacterium]MBO6564187.1 5-(carboxyamino)imidazole ribonucleotide synthase [Pseudomonadales bacterium]MBO6597046.1 5-(carboxyamino)imidazole ribonucleotide synthase [Pseudomonadales bacterium]MBO6656138.1 5-(carboxyamino)imidazole ribonucleotide synthase [Pseudomonadales bacterium]MBO6703689.1 5-(carboxyamino)imidazole ribonucleotide synthase [Pseudomonadales bacterium]
MTESKIGIVGGGQLAGLLAQEVNRLGGQLFSLDPDPQCPAVLMGAEHVEGDRHSAKDIQKLASLVDVITIDLEDVNVEALADLSAEGFSVVPDPKTLQLMTNKLHQKEVFQAHNLPTSPFTPYDGSTSEGLDSQGWPAVQKAAEGGYDGRGVAIIEGPADAGNRLPAPGFVEAFVPGAIELSVMVARDALGHTKTWATTEMEFDDRGNLLAYLIAPARIPEETSDKARDLATRAIEAFHGVGIFGVELFLTQSGELLINEIAPRTHNSGHYTIDACATSQFRQQYNILTGKAMEDTRQNSPAVMFNLLGDIDYEGDTVVEGLDVLLETIGVHPYLYGKQSCFPLRKMGHVTVVADTAEAAQALGDKAKTQITIRGDKRITS